MPSSSPNPPTPKHHINLPGFGTFAVVGQRKLFGTPVTKAIAEALDRLDQRALGDRGRGQVLRIQCTNNVFFLMTILPGDRGYTVEIDD